MPHQFTVSAVIPATPLEVYAAWLDSMSHAAMTGSPANVSARVGDSFTAWDGYISGRNLALEPGRRIVQAWRTTEFAASDPDSQIEITLEPADGGANLTLEHTNIPANQPDYKSGWRDFYFKPMTEWFSTSKRS